MIELDELKSRVSALMPQAKADLTEMVSFRSVHDPQSEPPEECDKMVDWLLKTFPGVGAKDVKAHETSDGSKAVTGHIPGPAGAPTVLLYFHHDVQPPLDESAWTSPVWTLTEKDDGRWYGRGAADCKGNIAMHLTALRALGDDLPVNVKIVGEGSEEQGTGGLEDFVPKHAELLEADAILVCDAGNFELGKPSLTSALRGLANVVVTVETLKGPVHSGMFGGPAPDAMAAMVLMLASLRDEKGDLTIEGVDATQTWKGAQYPEDQFRSDAGVLDGVDLIGSGTISDMLWARPTVTILGMDCPTVSGSAAAINAKVRARLNLRVPPGMNAKSAQDALVAQLEASAPWGVKVTCERQADGEPFTGATSGPAIEAMEQAMKEVYGVDAVFQGQGGSIPLCNVFHDTFPDASITLIGVEEPKCLIHAPNESVAPSEIENMSVVEARFLQLLAQG